MIARVLRFSTACAAIVLGACGTTRPYESSSRSETRPPVLSFSSITAPVGRTSHRELRHLEADPTPAARLREAYILIETQQVDAGLTKLNSILFGSVDAGPAVESFARYLRAIAFDKRGETDRAAHERSLALARAFDPELRRALDPPIERPSTAVAADHLSMLPRSAWRPSKTDASMRPMGRVFRVTVHHSAMPARDPSRDAAVATIRAIQRHHQVENGWSDIGYHYLIDPAGRIWEGRQARWQGAHAGDPERNRGNLGICLLGNFVDRTRRPTSAQVRSLEQLIGAIQRRHGFGDEMILTHRELKGTTCPGKMLQLEVDRIRGFSAAHVTQ